MIVTLEVSQNQANQFFCSFQALARFGNFFALFTRWRFAACAAFIETLDVATEGFEPWLPGVWPHEHTEADHCKLSWKEVLGLRIMEG